MAWLAATDGGGGGRSATGHHEMLSVAMRDMKCNEMNANLLSRYYYFFGFTYLHEGFSTFSEFEAKRKAETPTEPK